MSRSGANLALLLLGNYRAMVDSALSELADRGFDDVRPIHEFAMRAIDAGADTASDLGRRMSVTKQAASKTIAALLERGYVVRRSDPNDARRKQIVVTERGHRLMAEGEAIFDDIREDLRSRLGDRGLAALERSLTTMIGDAGIRLDAPGLAAQELD